MCNENTTDIYTFIYWKWGISNTLWILNKLSKLFFCVVSRVPRSYAFILVYCFTWRLSWAFSQFTFFPSRGLAASLSLSQTFNKRSAHNSTYTNDFMIPHNLPHAIQGKCYDQDDHHDAEHYRDDDHTLALTVAISICRLWEIDR